MPAVASTSTSATRWSAPLREPAVWLGAVKVAVPVALLQIAINQGDHLLRGEITRVVLAKTLLTPTVTFTVAVLSAATAWRARRISL